MRKKSLVSLVLFFAVALAVTAQQRVSNVGKMTSVGNVEFTDMRKAPQRATAFEILACPEGTVVGGSYTEDAETVGYQNAEMARPSTKTRYYQSFSGCYYNITSLRFVGMFSYFDDSDPSNPEWPGCTERGGIDPDTHEMTEPITLEVKFYKMGEDGKPGEVVFDKLIDVVGKYNKIIYEKDKPLYEFNVDLGEPLKMESGFFSVASADKGKEESCWLSLFCATSVPFKGMLQIDNGEIYDAWMPMIFCLKSDGTVAADKSLKIQDVLVDETAYGKHEKVKVRLANVGGSDITDTRLELWAGGSLLATEDVSASIEALGGTYDYMFTQRIDCSTPGVNEFEVRNVTPGDENLTSPVYKFRTYYDDSGAYCVSESSSSSYESISSVTIGDISCESGASKYTDNRDLKTTLKAGEELELTVGHNAKYAIAWIDWDGNSRFDNSNECLGVLVGGKAKVAIPEGNVTPGEKLLRIVASYEMPSPCGNYDFGETEDYTIVVEYNSSAARMTCSTTMIDEVMEGNSVKNVAIEFGNEGVGRRLEGTITSAYILPKYPSSNYVFDKDLPSTEIPQLVPAKAPVAASAEPAPGDNTAYTMRYDRGLKSAVALTSNVNAIYGQYYPGEMLKSLEGMEIESIDIYIANAPKKTTVVIYDENTQKTSGKLLYSQEFTPVSNSWNHVDLSRHVKLTGKDLWVGVNFEGIDTRKYCIGTDLDPAMRGYGDIVNIGGDIWWSLGDLGIEANFCIRTNFGGKASPTINWLSFDKTSFVVSPSAKTTVNATLNTAGMAPGLYEAMVEVRTNDELASLVRMPVYLSCGDVAQGIESVSTERASLSLEGGRIAVTSEKAIASISLTDMASRLRRISDGGADSAAISLEGLHSGIYILTINYADGSRETVKIPVAAR